MGEAQAIPSSRAFHVVVGLMVGAVVMLYLGLWLRTAASPVADTAGPPSSVVSLQAATQGERRDLATLDSRTAVAVAAEAGRTSVVARLFDHYQWVDDRADELTTQEKAWLILAAHALSARQGKLELAVNGERLAKPNDHLSLAPDLAALTARPERFFWRALLAR